MTDNFNAVANAHTITMQELAQFTINAIEASFISDSQKQAYRLLVDRYLEKAALI